MPRALRIDCHVHIAATTPGHGFMSPRLQASLPFRFMRWKFGIAGHDAATERALELLLLRTLNTTPELDAAVVLAFDAVHREDGTPDRERTHLHVANDYVAALARRHAGVLFGASVHPYRADAAREVARCVADGAVLMKWLPPTQGMDPSDPRCIPFYEALAHFGLPLLCHTGGELSLPVIDRRLGDPRLLEEALRRGVRVICAHCGTRGSPFDEDFLPAFRDLTRRYEHCYGDTAALNLPNRSYAWRTLLSDAHVRSRLLHGSDWPILSIPPASRLGAAESLDLLRERNWMRRDVLIKQRLGLEEAHFTRASQVLRPPWGAGHGIEPPWSVG